MNLVDKKSEYSEDIVTVHNEFETASDKLLKEVKSFLSKTKVEETDKIKKLKKIGFTKTKEVVLLEKKKKGIAGKTEILNNIQYFKEKYPFNKYITEDKVLKICKKYGLVCGEISDYVGFVPESKINDIEKFKLKKEDWKELTYYESILQSFYSVYFGDKDVNNKTKKEKVKPSLNICAPAKDFNLSGKEIKGHKIVNKPIPDPVVLQPVNGGYLIVTAWGDEASDPEIVNEIEN